VSRIFLPLVRSIYGAGGYTVFVPRAMLQPVAMSREDAMKFILTGGLKSV